MVEFTDKIKQHWGYAAAFVTGIAVCVSAGAYWYLTYALNHPIKFTLREWLFGR